MNQTATSRHPRCRIVVGIWPSYTCFIFALLAWVVAAHAEIVLQDNWSDLTVTGPSYNPTGAEWAVDSGVFSANAASPPPSFYGAESGKLMFQPNTASVIHLNFGPTFAGTPVVVRFKVGQVNGAYGCSYRFKFGFKDTFSGNTHYEYAALNPAYYGTSGFQTYRPGWLLWAGTSGKALMNGCNYMVMEFDPGGYIRVWQAVNTSWTKAYDDSSLTYTMVAEWFNYSYLGSVNQFVLDNCSAAVSWKVDDVEIDFTEDEPADGWLLKPTAVQTFYQNGVPHTDKNGSVRLSYDPAVSFFPIGLWGTWVGPRFNQTWSYSDFAAAGFNTAVSNDPYVPLTATLADAAQSAGIQLMKQFATDAEINAIKNHPATLAWVEIDEPTPKSTPQMFQEFLDRIDYIKNTLGDTQHPITVVDTPSVVPPCKDTWIMWSQANYKVALHDNYPVFTGSETTFNTYSGIGATASLAALVNNQTKPVWLLEQSFEQSVGTFLFAFPTNAQVRCNAYTSIIHGATGVFQFIMDSYWSRGGSCVGIAPAAKSLANYGDGYVATPEQLTKSTALWNYLSTTLNPELAEMKPVFLSPTSTEPYEVYIDPDHTPVSWNPIRTMLKTDPAGGLTLLLVNVDGVDQRVKIRFPNKQIVAVEKFGNLGFTQSGDSIIMDCPAWDARVLRIFIMEPLFSDNFSDNIVANPTYSPTGAQWVAESGLLSAGSDTPTGFTFYNPLSGTLMFHSGAVTKASINFGSTVANTQVEVRFKLRQTNGSSASLRFDWGFKDTISGKSIEQWASPNGGYFGTGGFYPGGLGSAYKLSTSGWDYLKYIYNPSTKVVDVWFGRDGVTYTKAATWTDTQGVTSVNQFYFRSGGAVSWMVDDVQVLGVLE